MAKAPNGERVIAIKGDSLESLAGLLARGLTSSLDAVYVDGSHQVSQKATEKQMEHTTVQHKHSTYAHDSRLSRCC